MAAPHLESVSFPHLHGQGAPSDGTITGTNIKEHDTVRIVSNSSNKKWQGEVTTHNAGNIWNATVRRLPTQPGTTDAPQVSETVGVTVTNGDGASNSVATNSSNVP